MRILSPVAAADAEVRTNTPSLLLVIGAPGEPEFSTNFVRQAELWQKAADRGGVRHRTIGLETSESPDDLTRFHQALDNEEKDALTELWIVLIGHGTFDGREARFNLRGPDFTANELGEWLKPFHRPVVFVNTSSASAPFMKPLSATNRVVVVATRSGFEQNYTRFGRFLAESLQDAEGDLDQDGQTSILEAFLRATHRVEDFYKTDGRLASEHALIDDNGDGQGTPADWFRGTRATKKSQGGAAVDGARARQRHLVPSLEEMSFSPEARARRDALELDLETLREQRASLKEDEYYTKAEAILMELATLRHKAASVVKDGIQ
jgi:hypothetical protein